jgi:hypothetical protein
MNTYLDILFAYSNYIAMAGWLLLIFAPRWHITQTLIAGGYISFLTGLLYLVLFIMAGDVEGGYGSLADVYMLFGNRHALLAGWIHYLGFDLFIGAWQVTQARRHSIPHLVVVPCLFLTFWFGPIGFALFLIIRLVKTKKIGHESF